MPKVDFYTFSCLNSCFRCSDTLRVILNRPSENVAKVDSYVSACSFELHSVVCLDTLRWGFQKTYGNSVCIHLRV
jgi:hypothetical protein